MTTVSKNVYIDKLNDIVGKYKNTYSSTIKMKPIDFKDTGHTVNVFYIYCTYVVHILVIVLNVMIKILNLKLVIM